MSWQASRHIDLMTVSRIAITIALFALALCAGKFGCRSYAQMSRAKKLSAIQLAISAKLNEIPKSTRSELTSRLKAAMAQNAKGGLSPIAIDTLRQRTEAVLADGHLFPREAQHLIRLLNDFPQWQDEIHAIKYMGQR